MNNDNNQKEKEEEVLIRPVSKLKDLSLRDLYKYRHILWRMVYREIRLTYDNLSLGFFWSAALPLTMMFTFVILKRFSRANMFETVPYSIYAYSGLIMWFNFREACAKTMYSVGKDSNLIKKVYFPRLYLPMVPIIAAYYNLALAAVPLVIMMLVTGLYPGFRILLLPVVLFQYSLLVFGIGTIFTTLSLIKKDFERLLILVLYVGLFISPVIYAPDMIPAKVRSIYLLNPMAGTLLAFRSCLFYDFPFPFWLFMYSSLVSVIFLIVGTIMFKKAEIYFADKL